MSQWTKFGTIAALSLSMALAGTGCLSSSDADDEMVDEQGIAATADDDGVKADVQAADEKTGEANEAWWGGFGRFGFPFFGGFGGCGLGFGGCGLGFGGCGLGLGFGGCGLGFGGCGFGGFGGCGFGGFGGCGFGGFGGCGGCF
ncbi:MAG: hypothetical protein QM820_45640 [Minicystis sp.]